jgi:hypothetical protein
MRHSPQRSTGTTGTTGTKRTTRATNPINKVWPPTAWCVGSEFAMQNPRLQKKQVGNVPLRLLYTFYPKWGYTADTGANQRHYCPRAAAADAHTHHLPTPRLRPISVRETDTLGHKLPAFPITEAMHVTDKIGKLKLCTHYMPTSILCRA